MTEPSRSVLRCPACGKRGPRHLDEVSKEALVNFYECAKCRHLWTVNKLDESKVTHITLLVRPQRVQPIQPTSRARQAPD